MSDYNKQLRILYQSKNYPIHECLINPNWQEIGQARIIISRKMPNNNLAVGVYLVDLYCLGLKDTFCDINLHQLRYESELKVQAYPDKSAIECDLNLAHNIIYGSIRYAKQLGFSPQEDFKLSQYVLELEQDIELRHDIRFGYEGQPFYIRGPHDDMERIIRTLEKTAGEGNFSVMCEEDSDILDSIDEMIKAGYLRPKKVGRNEPCPCGSGKKYKKCCLDKDRQARKEKLVDQDEIRGEKLSNSQIATSRTINYLKEKYDDIFHKSTRHFIGYHNQEKIREKLSDQFLAQLLNEYFLLDYEDEKFNTTMLKVYLEERGNKLDEEENKSLGAKIDSYKTLYEIQKIKTGQGFMLKDYFSGSTFWVNENKGTYQANKWDIIFARVENLENQDRALTGPIVTFPREGERYLEDLRTQYNEELKLFSGNDEMWLFNFRHLMTPMIFQSLIDFYLNFKTTIVNKEGDLFQFCKMEAEVIAYKKLKEYLQNQAKLTFVDRDKKETILNLLDKENSVIAVFRLSKEKIIIETNSKRRMQKIKRKFVLKIDSWTQNWLSEVKDIEEAMSDYKESPPDAEGEIPQKIADEIIKEKLGDYYKKWLDEQIPALDGMTPRQASKRSEMREKLINLLKYMENKNYREINNLIKFDIEGIKKELGINF